MIALASLIRDRAALLPTFLRSCDRLRNVDAFYFLVNDSTPKVVAQVNDWARGRPAHVEVRDHGAAAYREHVWYDDQADRRVFLGRIAAMRDRLLGRIFEDGHEACFMVDSDVLCVPSAVEHLVATGRDAVSLLYLADWGRDLPPITHRVPGDNERSAFLNWQLGLGRRPQCSPSPPRLPRPTGHRTVFSQARVRPVPRDPRYHMLDEPGVYECDVIGAATLIRRRLWDEGCRYERPLGFSGGEDAVFCRQARARGISLWVSSVLPTWHCDRPEITAHWQEVHP